MEIHFSKKIGIRTLRIDPKVRELHCRDSHQSSECGNSTASFYKMIVPTYCKVLGLEIDLTSRR
ncbi:hypothetical protein LEP1GSC133_4779 [Leptospira borgpetersenii serovar Pomona str. 200901868]|uniref:Uncharacterized protein n=1 Tax=Leptospira borgpetersenii serovar Pomona str. 200901868 TaxID=1192866 RepID=M6WP63_LEPBO|nr:hypothetical protein B9T54_13845 [Leptospira borgpetersenii serovar Hardjo-bovis]EKQ99471.1 hypothetical protein LEP1GSC121_2110 [Leptospira borgpetersenii serovar Castellonis str. 200801910]EMO09001.1 hypothetical protein LEP1GSC137_2531 [Leptospira borgpetersenii str. Noumea 25]EMO63528.1 hypothetical protein LEP1GSC133_4779 [Leptospira borgpetersenii serovar Pomona str. 200901868]OOV41733.1 hypothetical protein B1H38_17305 [Leptospira borgpetersenii serovar Ballum]QHE27958.1 hypothetical